MSDFKEKEDFLNAIIHEVCMFIIIILFLPWKNIKKKTKTMHTFLTLIILNDLKKNKNNI